jgi:hypothetical protein
MKKHTPHARVLAVAALLALVPFAAAAQTYTANLTPDDVAPSPGPDGASGFATIVISGTSITYNLLFSGVDDPTAAHIHAGAEGETGEVVVDFAASFTGGFAAGTVTSDQETVDAIVASPADYYVQVHSTDFPAGALRGQLGTTSGGAGATLYFPVVATVLGAAGTDFHTDARLVNRSGGTASVTLEYYPRGVGGNPSGPSETADVTIAPKEQAVLNDMATELFGETNGSGAVKIISDREIFGSARIFNDQRGAGLGTFGQWAQALSMSDALRAGTVQFMSNENPDSGEGFRGNVGWFNPNDSEVEVVLSAWDTAGTNLGSLEWTAGPYEQYQRNLGQLWSELSDYGDLYVTFTASAPVFVYGSLVDNVNGDAIYVPAE